MLMESESEVSISSDIVAWQRDIFLSVLDDSDEDWVIHDRAEVLLSIFSSPSRVSYFL